MSKELYYLVYKPFQVMSQFSAIDGKETLADYFQLPKDVYPIGRLDYDSEGLLLLTNDKSLNQKLLNPAFKHQREYWVQVEGEVTDQALEKLSKGVDISIDGKTHRTLPANAWKFLAEPQVFPRNPPIRFRANIPTSWISLVLQEGKNRQVRKMTAAVGFPTLRLIRHRIEKLNVEGLEPGNMIIMNKHDVYRGLAIK